ncbi:facilitated trehalose transporter Tret1-like [Agrilus planipennis]|uniref:Facilitated trehalose transporter Tret1-like n=1 Tax=Agrilus planipennis TaxID=224129 RepID=A0A1W4W7Z0_AGRPL|nr:facilitated trehalose transporter Tret1-like [Agrilus planipennis]XP_018320195.1 facilitated trehalose transporter Tret1-like [Agrilus planipennis]XP_018320196.1 facilitated trehalose transporter Tret1-like [Agrilus planipennis]XP_018320197.1 facilitated trehalose transporter Tret1-like [Agrilus planipennis]
MLEALRNRGYQLAAVMSCSIASFAVGLILTWTSPVFPKLNNSTGILDDNPFDAPITTEEQSWIASFLSCGAIFGPFVAGFLVDRIGRKWTLVCASGVPLTAAFLMLAFGRTPVVYYVARFIGGLGMGVVFTALPMYIGEISEAPIRGTMASFFNIFMVSGELASYALGPYIPIMWFSIICAIFPAAFVILFSLFPDSPHYYISKNNIPAAESSLAKLRGTDTAGIKKEFAVIKESVENDMKNRGTIADVIKNRGLRKALLICLGLVTLQQLSGIQTVLTYVTNIFNASGSSMDSDISSLIVGIVQFATGFTTPVFVDRLGRKMLFLISAVGMVISEVPLGVYFYLEENDHDVSNIGWLPVVSMIAYIITYNFGFGPLPWTVMGEVFPANVKAAASTITASFCWIMGFVVVRFFGNLQDAVGLGMTYWIFSAFCFVAIFFTLFFVIETKGKTFAEIQEILNR